MHLLRPFVFRCKLKELSPIKVNKAFKFFASTHLTWKSGAKVQIESFFDPTCSWQIRVNQSKSNQIFMHTAFFNSALLSLAFRAFVSHSKPFNPLSHIFIRPIDNVL